MRSKLWIVFLFAMLLAWFLMVAVSFAAPQAPKPPQAPPVRTVAWTWAVSADPTPGCDCVCGKPCRCAGPCECDDSEDPKNTRLVKKRCCTCLTEGTFCTCPSGGCTCGRWENHHGRLHEKSHRPGILPAGAATSDRVYGVPVTFGTSHGGTPFSGPPSYSAPMMPSFAPSFSGGYSGGGYSGGGGGGGSC